EYVGSQVAYSSNVGYALPAYSLWHLELSQKLNENLTLRGGIENLGDQRLDIGASEGLPQRFRIAVVEPHRQR
ncbi:hypothetical protein, partial [Pseudomonas aeruginosa]